MAQHEKSAIPEQDNPVQKNNTFSARDVLAFLSANGTISMDDVLNQIKRNELEEHIRSVHPYKIWQGVNDKRWRTYVKDEQAKSGKRIHTDAPTSITRLNSDWKTHYSKNPIMDIPIKDLTKLELDIWVHKFIQGQKPNKTKYCNVTGIMQQMLDLAVQSDMIPVNVFSLVKVDGKRLFRKDLYFLFDRRRRKYQYHKGEERTRFGKNYL